MRAFVITSKVGSRTMRSVVTRRLHSTYLSNNYHDIPGLIVANDFVSKSDQSKFDAAISDLFVRFRAAAIETEEKIAEIPQASKNHNLPSSESFRYLQVKLPNLDEPLKVEYFEKYGEEGHELAYIRGREKGNNNIPPFAWEIAQKITNEMKEAKSDVANKYISTGAEGMTWRLTLNYYTCLKDSKEKLGKRAGFPFHTDILANGDETFIVGFGNPARMEFVRHAHDAGDATKIQKVTVNPGALVGLTGDVRYHWLHRVVPEENTTTDRVSMVLGCRA